MGVSAAVPSSNMFNIPQMSLSVKPVVRLKSTLPDSEIHLVQLHVKFSLTVSRSSKFTKRLGWSTAWHLTVWRETPQSRTTSVTFPMKGSAHPCMRGPLLSTRARVAAPTTQRLLS